MSKSSREGHAWACPSLFGSRRRACAALDLEDYVREKYRDTLARTPLLPGEAEEDHRRREMSFLNLRWFMQALLAQRFRRMLDDAQAPIHRFLDREKAARFLAQPKDYGKPWFGQLMAGPQMLAYFLRVNAWMEDYGLQ